MVSMSRFFERTLGAKLRNPQWSWGAFDSTGRLFLRVWDNEIEQYSGGERIVVALKKPRRKSNGYPERQRHLKALKDGAECFGVVLKAVDFDTKECRRIKHFNKDVLLRLGELSEDSARIFARIDGRVSVDEVVNGSERALADDLAKIIQQHNTSATTIKALVDARLGQGAFRASVLQLWNGRCAVCGASTLVAIRASHIKPWRISTNAERLDPHNGLPLVASLDALFDAGLISFDAAGRMLVSPKLNQAERAVFGLGKRLAKKPSKGTAKYLAHHRTEIFKA
jgi:hypothetical protein